MEDNAEPSGDNEGEEVNPSGDNMGEEVTPSARTLSFSVNDGTDAVSGAIVTVGENTGTTGDAGGCTVKNVIDGEHGVTVVKDGYSDYTGTIIVSENNTSFTIVLTAL